MQRLRPWLLDRRSRLQGLCVMPCGGQATWRPGQAPRPTRTNSGLRRAPAPLQSDLFCVAGTNDSAPCSVDRAPPPETRVRPGALPRGRPRARFLVERRSAAPSCPLCPGHRTRTRPVPRPRDGCRSSPSRPKGPDGTAGSGLCCRSGPECGCRSTGLSSDRSLSA